MDVVGFHRVVPSVVRQSGIFLDKGVGGGWTCPRNLTTKGQVAVTGRDVPSVLRGSGLDTRGWWRRSSPGCHSLPGLQGGVGDLSVSGVVDVRTSLEDQVVRLRSNLGRPRIFTSPSPSHEEEKPGCFE